MEVGESELGRMFGAVLPLLDERQRRVLAGAQVGNVSDSYQGGMPGRLVGGGPAASGAAR